MLPKKIVIIGPESTGKSTLCATLAAHYNTIWIKEYARDYMLATGKDYSFEDLYHIAQGQLKNEEHGVAALADKNNLVFLDTDMYVMKVWSEFVFNKCDNRILTAIATRKYDLYLLCNIDLPWMKDELREYPDLATREKLFHYYKDLLVNQQTPWAIISGANDERQQHAIDFIDSTLAASI